MGIDADKNHLKIQSLYVVFSNPSEPLKLANTPAGLMDVIVILCQIFVRITNVSPIENVCIKLGLISYSIFISPCKIYT